MKKTNFISKTIILLLFSSILVCSAPYKKDKSFKGRIYANNLRNLKLTNDNFGFFIILSFCAVGTILMGLIELCLLCCHKCQCENEERLPDKCLFLYFSLCGCIIVSTIVYLIIKDEIIFYCLFTFLGPFVISSIIYLVKCINNKNKYCTDICTMEYLCELAKYPYPYYCACCLCNTFPKELCSRLGMLALVVAYVIGSAIEYYLFLLLYMFIMLITKIFSFCKCCTKKKEQTNPTNAPNDASQTPLKPEAVFNEAFVINEPIIIKGNNENNNEISENNAYGYENGYDNYNGNNNENYNEKGNDNYNGNYNENYNKISEGNFHPNENGNDIDNCNGNNA